MAPPPESLIFHRAPSVEGDAPPPGPNPDTIEAFVYLALVVLLIGFRVFCRTRAIGIGSLGPDDYLMIFSILPLVAETVVQYITGTEFHGLANSAMTDSYRLGIETGSQEWLWRVNDTKTILVGWIMYTTQIWMIKASMCTFYLRLTAGLEGYKIRILAGLGIIVSSYIAAICTILFTCMPFEKHWQIVPDPGSTDLHSASTDLCMPAINRVVIYTCLGLNIFSDLYLFLIPVPMFWAAKLPPAKKWGLTVLFSGGIVIIVFGILRCVSILKDDSEGPREGTNWALRESFVAVVVTNLPMTWGWLKVKLRPFLGSFLSTPRTKATGYGRTGIEGGSVKLDDISASGRWRDQQKQKHKSLSSSQQNMTPGGLTFLCETDSNEEDSIRPMSHGSHGIVMQVELKVSSERRSQLGDGVEVSETPTVPDSLSTPDELDGKKLK
ncbi:unnamed protein product [Clonostachys rosea]|uniref:Rhodopsin domain-containing protein n=1 Tax=Bionectria ochroleuca TaxID=29856 RepID=A0ABY6UI27_BIOOC|nr:unnamed protein product [Clonostachys rosea]